jgi:hypothetical protein
VSPVKYEHVVKENLSDFNRFLTNWLYLKTVSTNNNPDKSRVRTKQTRWPLVRKKTIPTERPPLVDEI